VSDESKKKIFSILCEVFKNCLFLLYVKSRFVIKLLSVKSKMKQKLLYVKSK